MVELVSKMSVIKGDLFVQRTKQPFSYRCKHMIQFQIEGEGVVQGVTKLFSTFSAFVT